ncbi:MAG: pilus assembly protein PilM [Bacteroidales bacterium]|nr:pilus assembly protein PilM [Candidatus Latescibacterota bacterium]
MRLLKSRNTMLGLDISPRAVKLIEMERVNGTKKVLSHAISEWDGQDDPGLDQLEGGLLKKLVLENNIHTKKVVTIVPHKDLTERFVELPFSAGNKMGEYVKWEIPKHINYPVEEATYDYICADSSQREKCEVHLAITRKDSVDRIVSIIRDAGLIPEVIETRSTALHRLVKQNPEWMTKTVTLLDIEYRWTSMLVISEGTLRMSRRIENGKRDIVTSIAVLSGCELDEAENLLMDLGFDEKVLEGESVDPTSREFNVYSAIERPVDRMLADMKRSYEFYKAQYGIENDPDLILISGETSCIPNLDRFISMKTGNKANVIRIEDLSGLQIDGKELQVGSFTIALGLAMR